MSKTPATITRDEIQAVIGDIDTVTDLMEMISNHVPGDEIHGEWFSFFGRAIDHMTARIEEAIGRMP